MADERKWGWRPDVPDHRDLLSAVRIPDVLPRFVDFRSGFPAPYDQQDLGACTAHAIAGNMEFDQIKEALKFEFTPSRLWIYYQERVIEHCVSSDSGAMIRDGIKAVNQFGVPPESDWPYHTKDFATKPADVAFTDARFHRSLKYSRVPVDLPSIKAVLAQHLPICFGFSVYESFQTQEVARTGNVPMPDRKEKLLGGHAVCLAGYSDDPWTDGRTMWEMQPGLIVRNSWGPDWGLGGYFVLPFGFVDELMDDLWTIEVVS